MNYFDDMYSKSRFTEIEQRHYDDIQQVFCIDAWETTDPDEEGRVIARINLKGDIHWEDESAKDDVLVKYNIEQFFNNHYFDSKEDIVENMLKIVKYIYPDNTCYMNIIHKDGSMRYGIQRITILDCECFAVGMTINGQFKAFPTGWGEESLKKIVDWMLADITECVGEEFCIEIED